MSAVLLLGCGAAPETEDVGEASLAIVTLYVNTPADGPDASPGDGICATTAGQCSLRAAIMEANAVPGLDIIHFAIPDPLAPVVLTIPGSGPEAGDLDITDAVWIISEGPRRRTIDARAANDRVFDIDLPTASAVVRLEGLTITRGRSSPNEDGGGIRAVDGNVTLKNVGVKRNSSQVGGGMSFLVNASVTLDRVDIEDNAAGHFGGGAFIQGPATIVRSNIARNRALGHGGLFASGAVTLDRVTIAGNRAPGHVAATFGASSSLRAVTVSDNIGSVGVSFGGAASIVESTIADNGKNVDRCTTCVVSVERSIIANGPGFTGPSCVQPLASQGKNLDSDNTCGFSVSGDIPGVDPMLEPLGYSMGHTQTRGLEPGSPAIDAAGAGLCKNKADQRGVPRPQAGACDIGAFEVQPPTFVVVSASDWPDANPGDGLCQGIKQSGCTLRAAIMETNALPGPNTIALNLTAPVVLARAGAGEDGATTGDLDITDNLTIRGQDWQQTRIDGNGAVFGDRIFDVDPAGTGISVLLADMVVDNGRAASEGGGIRNNAGARVALAYVLVRDNSLADPYLGFGGGLHNKGYAEVRDFTFFDQNDAGAGDGGAVFNSGDLFVVDSWLNNNAAGGRGGGLRNLSGRATVWRAAVSANDAYDSGGISNTGDLVIWRSAVDDNTAVRWGAGIRNQVPTATLQIEDSSVSENIGALTSAGIFSAGFVSATNVTISGNQASNGGLDLSGGAELRHVTIVGNTFGITAGPGVTMTNSIIAGSTFNGSNCVGTVTSGGGNIDSGNSCGFTMPANKLNTDPMLGALAHNGGAYSRTHALDPASPAIDFAHPAFCPAADQRGFPRPASGFGCDSGAFER